MDRLAKSGRFRLLGAAAIVAIMAGVVVAMPAYKERARLAEIREAFQNLSDAETWMRGYHQHYRSYSRGDVCGAAVIPEDRARYFDYSCALNTAARAAPGQSYTITARGKAGHTTGFTFTINEAGARATVSIPPDWGPLPENARAVWVDRKP